jgi:putative Holliday junction resolvase
VTGREPWLGVDLGAARVGLALSDPDRRLAMPLATLDRAGRGAKALARALAAEARAQGAGRVVVGLPLNMDGTESPGAAEARDVAAALEARGVAASLQDERRSSVEAHASLREAGRKTKAHKAVVDQAAAVVILQAALDRARAAAPNITKR